MIRKDFILRLIEEIAKAIGKMLHLINEGDIVEAEKIYHQSFEMLKDLDEERVKASNVEQLYSELSQEHGNVEDLFQQISYLLYLGGKMYQKQDEPQRAASNFSKAKDYITYIDTVSSTYSLERNNLLSMINKELV